MKNSQQFDIFEKPQIESDESVVQAAEATVAEKEEAEKERQSVCEAMKEEGFLPDNKKTKNGRKGWLALGRKLNGEDKQEELL